MSSAGIRSPCPATAPAFAFPPPHARAAAPIQDSTWRRDMPAVTVDDITTLPHIPLPDPLAAHERPVLGVTTAPHGVEGEGFPVRRAFAAADPRLLDPFVLMDQMGEVEY